MHYGLVNKIVYITNQICGSGGLERVLSIKLDYLIEHFGYDIHVITLNQGTSQPFFKFNKKITYHNLVASGKLTYFFNYLTGLRKLILKINPDIISVCDDGLKGLFVPWYLHKPCSIVYERHASKYIFNNNDRLSLLQNLNFKLRNFIMDVGAKQFDTVIVLTNANLKEWKINNIKVIPNPLSFYPKEKAALINKKVITVGNHGFQKGYDRLLQIWKLVAEKHPDWRLEVYGKIDKEKKHIKLAEKLGISDKVFFFEPINNIQDKYKDASIYAMSSRSEGFGMVLIEAMACGLPCIAFDCPSGPKDIISEGTDGFLIKNGIIEKFADKINEIIINQELRLKMGDNARNKAKSYVPNNIMPIWDGLFNSLIEKYKK